MPLPDSVQALIAARLDTLGRDTKSLLADAAVIGKVFWAGAVARMGDRDPLQVTATLRELSRKELVRPARQSSMEGEAEYAFWHVLARDVAYHQLPRASRAARHVAAAGWLESKAAGASKISPTSSPTTTAPPWSSHARPDKQSRPPSWRRRPAGFLRVAGERTLGLDTAAALASFERALELTPAAHPDRPRTLARFGDAAFQAARYVDAAQALDEAITALRASGDVPAATTAMITLGKMLGRLGDPRSGGAGRRGARAARAAGARPRARRGAHRDGHHRVHPGTRRGGLRHAERALAVAERLGLARPARALGCPRPVALRAR